MLTLQGSWIAKISNQNSLGSIFKNSSLNNFQPVRVRVDQSASFKEKEVGATAIGSFSLAVETKGIKRIFSVGSSPDGHVK